MTYKLYKTNINLPEDNAVSFIDEQNCNVSFILGLDNPEEKAYLAWVAENNVAQPADEVTQ